MITLIARIQAKEGLEKDLEKALTALVNKVDGEQGTLEYVLHRSLADPRTFMFYEVYQDEAALKHHSTTEHFKETMKAIAPYLDKRAEIETYVELCRIA